MRINTLSNFFENNFRHTKDKFWHRLSFEAYGLTKLIIQSLQGGTDLSQLTKTQYENKLSAALDLFPISNMQHCSLGLFRWIVSNDDGIPSASLKSLVGPQAVPHVLI